MSAERSSDWFPALSRRLAALSGRAGTFVLAIVLVLAWLVTGPMFDYSNTWQLVINTSTTIVTFLMVFLIQNTQNRDAEAAQIKLDEIIRATQGAHNAILDLEHASEEELAMYHKRYADLAGYARQRLERGGTDDDCPVIDELAARPAKEKTAVPTM